MNLQVFIYLKYFLFLGRQCCHASKQTSHTQVSHAALFSLPHSSLTARLLSTLHSTLPLETLLLASSANHSVGPVNPVIQPE